MIVGIVAAMLLAAGLLPPYAELWKRGGRVMATHLDFWPLIGWGLFFALMEIVAQTTFDPLGGCLFIVWYVLSTLIKSWHRLLIMQSKISSSKVAFFVPHGIWRLLRTRKLCAAAKAAGCAFDDLPESEPYRVDVPRRGSIAASRDIEHVEIERRRSRLALARERGLEAGHRSSSKGYDYREDRFDEERKKKC